MEEIIRCGEYTFRTVKETNPHRPYKVCCIETGVQNDSAISYQDAINLVISQMNYANTALELFSCDAEKVKKLFEERLLNRSKAECDAIVAEIVDNQAIKGNVYKVSETDDTIEYLTDNLLIKVQYRSYIPRRVTKITVEDRKT